MIIETICSRRVKLLVNALVRDKERKSLLVVQYGLKPYWILPGGQPEKMISPEYFEEFVQHKVMCDIHGLELEIPREPRNWKNPFVTTSPRGEEIQDFIYLFNARQGGQVNNGRGVYDLQWITESDRVPLSPLTQRIIRHYRNLGAIF